MPLFPRNPPRGRVPILNSASPWASSREDLEALWACPYTEAITTRTTTLRGFPDQPEVHQVAFFGAGAHSSINSYGYSPHPLSRYLSWLREILQQQREPPRRDKRVIVSVTGSLDETREMLEMLERFAATEVPPERRPIAVEFNLSCPNIPGYPPPAYSYESMLAYLQLLAGRASPNLLLGIKLPPFTYHDQFEAVIEALRVVAKAPSPSAPHPISFLTSTNTLGQGLVFAAEETPVPRDLASSGRPRPPAQDQLTALPSAKSDSGSLPGVEGSVEGGWGGLAGGTLHPLAVGNVARLAQVLRRPDPRPPLEGDSETEHGEEEVVRKLAGIAIVGVGGVSDAEGVERFRRAGADAVACATAFGREGLAVFDKMSRPPSRL
ncbi:hypothetical protein JCM8202_003799 [Rhodotorula sphaerocarpa]